MNENVVMRIQIKQKRHYSARHGGD